MLCYKDMTFCTKKDCGRACKKKLTKSIIKKAAEKNLPISQTDIGCADFKPKRRPYTPKSRIRAVARQLFLRSREAQQCKKKYNNTCCICGAKQSTAKGKEVKTNVHHVNGIDNWDEIDTAMRKHLLNVDEMIVLCESCHKKETEKQLTPKDKSVE